MAEVSTDGLFLSRGVQTAFATSEQELIGEQRREVLQTFEPHRW